MSYDVTEYFAQLVWMIVISQLVHGALVYWHNIIVDNMLYRDIMTTGTFIQPPQCGWYYSCGFGQLLFVHFHYCQGCMHE